MSRQREWCYCAYSQRYIASSCCLRFVVAPDGKVVPDLKGDLPGNALWLLANRQVVSSAYGNGLFGPLGAVCNEPIADKVEILLRRQLLSYLHLLRRSGQLVCGFEKVKAALTAKHPAALLQAADASADGKEKLAKIARHMHIRVFDMLTQGELSSVTGNENQVHILLGKSGLADVFLKESNRLSLYVMPEDEAVRQAVYKDFEEKSC